MGNDELYIFNRLKGMGKEGFLKEAMEMTTEDIKANRIAFNKKTSAHEFMTIFFRSLNLCARY